jgi:hypothetical protein
MHLGRIEFNIVLFVDWSFASGCSPTRPMATQFPSATTDRPVFPSGRDFHALLVRTFRRAPEAPSGHGINCLKSGTRRTTITQPRVTFPFSVAA